MWMPPQTTTPPLRTAARAAGTSAPIGAKMIAASSGSTGRVSDPPAQAQPSLAAQALRGRGEGVTRRPPADPKLPQQVGGRAEAVEPQPLHGPTGAGLGPGAV